jgi:hypothetical protein
VFGEIEKMVYCVKCGTKNEDDAKVCAKCGASLYTTGEPEYYRRLEHECFGIPRGGAIITMIFGLFIILWGLSFFLQEAYGINLPIWPFAIILFGLLIIIGAIYGMRRRW